MPNRLSDAISPYLRSHADNPVDWYGWGDEAFADAQKRDLPVLVSIGYSTCHWCHVMARESFSDPDLAAYLNAHFVSIKVDREEHPDVDASYLAAASAFTEHLGWPLNVIVTPEGKAFYAGTYFPPVPMQGHPSFRQVLEAVTDAWTTRRGEVTSSVARVAAALAQSAAQPGRSGGLPDEAALSQAVTELAADEDVTHGGFGGAPKFPVAPVLGFLIGRADGRELALQTLKRMGASPLRDPVEGGFFRYATRRDWSEPHYERMLYDNAQLLDLYTQAWKFTGEQWARTVAKGVADFLLNVMQLPAGGFASAQDSESTVAGRRVEGGYYALEEEDRRAETPPALDAKVLTGWNGLAIQALAQAGFTFDNADYTAAARRAADYLLTYHQRDDGALLRASIGGRTSTARATLEDYGMCARGLLELALLTGEVEYATSARRLMDSTLAPSTDTHDAGDVSPFAPPNGADPVLVGQGATIDIDASEGAYPSGLSAAADAAYTLHLLTAEPRYRQATEAAMALIAGLAPARPIAFGAGLALMTRLIEPIGQLVIVMPSVARPDRAGPADSGDAEADLLEIARRRATGLVAAVTDEQATALAEAGFELFAERSSRENRPTAYLCRDFVCLLPVTDAGGLVAGLTADPATQLDASEQ